MRRNYDRRRREAEEKYDRVYVDWPHLWRINQVVAKPLKTIYINRSSSAWGQSRVITDVSTLEDFCERNVIELP